MPFFTNVVIIFENQTYSIIHNTISIDRIDQELSLFCYIRLSLNMICLKINENVVLLRLTEI